MAWRTAALARSVLAVAPLDSVPCWAIAGVPANAVAASSIVAIARAFSILGLLNLGCRQRAAGLATPSWQTALRAMAMPGPGGSLIRRGSTWISPGHLALQDIPRSLKLIRRTDAPPLGPRSVHLVFINSLSRTDELALCNFGYSAKNQLSVSQHGHGQIASD